MTLICDPETETAPPRRKKRPIVMAFAVIAALAIAWGVAGIFLYVAPPSDEPEHADVVFVLGPPDNRISYAEQLMQQGYAPALAVSSPVGKDGKFEADICAAHRSYRIICFNPDPFTTQGEARALRDLSSQYGWKNANVLTAQFHVTRARVIMGRCYGGDLRMVAYRTGLPLLSLSNPKSSWAYEYVYQTAAFVKVAIHPDC
ncbi:YdcF family protein [Arthrobacter sp. MMS18-M83]|uniref:YdcF family protein n=1 Tax=Arthrobacter sp. MMS18-M83 TaxID=2996261 RepID=UPI00227D5E1B|nr:ElyC/SanA/YdcF family protein [Arthrobacter sp. MMS18-M83]WAH95922.1 YdcF family protein [Arthrobacter sp. MMS18-M83]